jgi:hypothetical protein
MGTRHLRFQLMVIYAIMIFYICVFKQQKRHAKTIYEVACMYATRTCVRYGMVDPYIYIYIYMCLRIMTWQLPE